jgi:hypothetical protein
VVIGLAYFAKTMAPIHKGNSNDFWYATCHIKLEPNTPDIFSSVPNPNQGNQFIYKIQGLHGSRLFKVNKSEVFKDWPKALPLLEEKAADKDPNNFVVTAFLKWKETSKYPEDVNSLIMCIREHLNESLYDRPNGSIWVYTEQQSLNRRLLQAKWYWANFVFEFIWLSGLIWFVFWPFIKRKKAWVKALHLSLAPIFLLLPAYFGYATFSFTSCGPCGGVLYPWVAIWFGGWNNNPVDIFILEHLPQILEPLSQGTGDWIAITGLGFFGPTKAVLAGIIVFGTFIVFSLLYDLDERRKKKDTSTKQTASKTSSAN